MSDTANFESHSYNMEFQVPGPITSTTRRVYELKLQLIEMTNDDRTSDPTPVNYQIRHRWQRKSYGGHSPT